MTKLKPALLGGVITGVLCVIPFVSTCCCIWAVVGGFLAGFLYIRGSAGPVSAGDGGVVGVLSGLVGSVIYLIIGLPIALIFGAASMEEQFRRSGIEIPLSGVALALAGALLVIVLILICSALGGLLAVPIFGKGKGQAAPPPPPPPTPGGPGGYGSGI